MPVESYIDRDSDILVINGVGDVTLAECIGALDKIVDETEGTALRKPMLCLLDPSASLNQLDLSALIQLKAHSEACRQKYPGTRRRTAFIFVDVVRDPVAPMWKALAESSTSLNADVGLFRNKEEALAWLKAG